MQQQPTIYHVAPSFAGRVIAENASDKTFTLVLIDGTRQTVKLDTSKEINGAVPVTALFVPKDQKFKNIPLETISSFKLSGKEYHVSLKPVPKVPRKKRVQA
jgi:hypothetical protein